MIYFDNAATTMQKPTTVGDAVAHALRAFGNPGRSFTGPSMDAARAVLLARMAVAKLVALDDPSRVAFTSGCTESLSLIARTFGPDDHIITTELEHNSVLRNVHLCGCAIDIIPADGRGNLITSNIASLFRPNTRAAFITHGSNLTGNITDIAPIRALCGQNDVPLILDAAQTLGSVPVHHDMADVICFTGHKALLGPQGTGGLIVRHGLRLPILKTGGTGSNTFESVQPAAMPDLAESGTPNAHGLAGLRAGIEYILESGPDRLMQREQDLTRRFHDGLSTIPGVQVVGDFSTWPRLPIVSFGIEHMDSADIALALWEDHGIATRAGGHCAPLMHRRLGTERAGLVRCSFSSFNAPEEIDAAIRAIRAIAARR